MPARKNRPDKHRGAERAVAHTPAQAVEDWLKKNPGHAARKLAGGPVWELYSTAYVTLGGLFTTVSYSRHHDMWCATVNAVPNDRDEAHRHPTLDAAVDWYRNLPPVRVR